MLTKHKKKQFKTNLITLHAEICNLPETEFLKEQSVCQL